MRSVLTSGQGLFVSIALLISVQASLPGETVSSPPLGSASPFTRWFGGKPLAPDHKNESSFVEGKTFDKVHEEHCRHYELASALLRGGASTATRVAPGGKDPVVNAYRLQQQLYLQSRSLQLRQALIQRGFVELQHSVGEQTAQNVDWDCAVATKESPKSCLYSFDAQIGSKVVAPIDTEQWITLAALNRLRRNDPSKVEPLWHSQYNVLKTWFHPNNSPYSFYTHLTPLGTVLSCLLDAPILLATTMYLFTAVLFLLTFPVWETFVKVFLTSPILWLQWHQWARFLHAALPLKLLLGQMAWKALASLFTMFYNRIRDRMVEWECQILEDSIPLTILPDNDKPRSAADEKEAESEEEE